MKIQPTNDKKAIRTLKKYYDSNKLNFDLAIQRKDNIWDLERKSLIIHSILYGYPIPPIFSVEKNNTLYNFIDGKQRLTSIFEYIDNKYKLSDNTPDVNDIKIAGCKFEDLNEEEQNEIILSNISITFLKNIEEYEIEEMFFRLNNGVALTKMELTRAMATGKVMNYVNEVAATNFFSNIIALTDGARKRYTDQEVILQILLLLMNDSPGFSGKEIQEFAVKLKDDGIPEDKQKIVNDTVEYLEQAIPVRYKELKKVHVPMVFMMAIKAQEDKIEPVKFGGWVQQFFKGLAPGGSYKNASRSKTATKESIKIRLEEITTDYEANIHNAPDFEAPAINTGRGRPSKKQEPEQQVTPQDDVGQELNQEQEQTLGDDDLNVAGNELEIQDDCQLTYDGIEDGISREEYQNQEVVI